MASLVCMHLILRSTVFIYTGVIVKEKIKELEFKLRKMVELNKQSQATKEISEAKSNIGNVIRRRKGDPDKRISHK